MNNQLKLDRTGQITIIQTAFIGDVALAMFLAEYIHRIAPHIYLTFVTTPQAAELPRIARAIDETIVYDKRAADKGIAGIRRTAVRITKSDCIIAPHRSFRTTLLAYLARPDFAVGFDRNAFAWSYRRSVKYHPHLHETERNNMLLTAFDDFTGSIHKAPRPKLNLSGIDISFASDYLHSDRIIPRTKIAVAPGSVWETKRWPAQYFIKAIHILKRFGIDICLIGGPADNPICSHIAENTGAVNFAGQTTIPQILALLENIDAVLTNDSAPTHFARLSGTPCATIFGPTVPEFGFAPAGPDDRIIQGRELNCRPCAIHGGRKCPLSTYECMRMIRPEYVADQLIDMTI
jgi:heptosyltransferase-2